MLHCLEGELYSYAKQTASSLLFNTGVRQHGETEQGYADALKQLAVYAYKDATTYFLETRCCKQFLAGFHSKEVRSHQGLCCSRDARVQELVSCAEAYWASCTELELLSDNKGSAATVAHMQGKKPGATFKQWKKATGGGTAVKSTGKAS